MRYCLFAVAFVGWTAAFAADNTPLLAHVIDSSTNRIPSHTVAPEYPRKARRDRVEGEVQVCFDVDRNGRTHRIAVRNSTHRAFEKPSIKAVRASYFRPVSKDEELQAIKSCRVFIFSLEPVEREDDVVSEVDRLKQFAVRYTRAWNGQDPASVAAFFAAEGTLFVNGTPSVGREAIAAVVASFMSGFPDMVLTMDALDIEPDRLIFRWTFVGTNSGPEGTGNAVNFSGYEEWTIDDDGLIGVSLGNFDNDEYQRQLKNGI
jgi:uncharacterized protein (TIGR02246 family)